MRPQISTESETEPSAFRKLFGFDDDVEGDGDYVSHRFGFMICSQVPRPTYY